MTSANGESSLEGRRSDLAAGLAEIRQRIERARIAAGRADDVRLIVVTKTFPASDVDLLASLGVMAVGENRDQEARSKRDECGPEAAGLEWHMIGQVQRKKASSVVRWATVVDSVDRPELVTALGRAAASAERTIGVLIQVSLDPVPQPGRGGIDPRDLPALADLVDTEEALRLDGVMGVAPHPDSARSLGRTSSEDQADEAFGRLYRMSEDLRRNHPQAREISAGMSGDLEQAIANGATQVRVGGAILGARALVQ